MVDAASEQRSSELAARLRVDIPHSARIWNYWLGGKDNYPADRAAGDAVIAVYPEIVNLARQGRQFLVRTVRFLAAQAGVRQFLDVGAGLPTMRNTHEVAQAVAPDSRIVYVDNDPLVLAHARALLTNTTPEGVTAYVDADFHDPDLIIADARNVLNFERPIAVIILGVLGHVAEFDEAKSIVSRLMDAVPSGSYLVLYDSVAISDGVVEADAAYARSGALRYVVRPLEQIRRFFGDLELVEPGLVSISDWRPDPVRVGNRTPVDAYGAVARKP